MRVFLLCVTLAAADGACGPEPPIWPERMMIVQRKVPDNVTQEAATTVTWYDSVAGANLIQISPDSNNSDVLWDLELDMHSFYHTPSRRTCKPMNFP